MKQNDFLIAAGALAIANVLVLSNAMANSVSLVGLKIALPGGAQPTIFLHDDGEVGSAQVGQAPIYFKVLKQANGSEKAFVSSADPSFGAATSKTFTFKSLGSSGSVAVGGQSVVLTLIQVPDNVQGMAHQAQQSP